MRKVILTLGLAAASAVAAQQPPNPRQQPGAMVTLFAPEQHDLYDGHFVVSANDASSRRGESRDTADRFLHPEPENASEESPRA